MALARLHGGPLDGQIIPLGSADDEIAVPYSETLLVYNKRGEHAHGEHDGPTEYAYWYQGSQDDLNPADV
jgi:hypothetical protein